MLQWSQSGARFGQSSDRGYVSKYHESLFIFAPCEVSLVMEECLIFYLCWVFMSDCSCEPKFAREGGWAGLHAIYSSIFFLDLKRIIGAKARISHNIYCPSCTPLMLFCPLRFPTKRLFSSKSPPHLLGSTTTINHKPAGDRWCVGFYNSVWSQHEVNATGKHF